MTMGWALLLCSALCFVAHAFITGGLEAAMIMSGTAFLVGGIWRKIDETHETLHFHRLQERHQRMLEHS